MENKCPGRHDKIDVNTIKLLPSVCNCQIQSYKRQEMLVSRVSQLLALALAVTLEWGTSMWKGSHRWYRPCPSLQICPPPSRDKFPVRQSSSGGVWVLGARGGRKAQWD